MTDPDPKRPLLWQVMRDSYHTCQSEDVEFYAAEIRAIADWLVPEERAPKMMHLLELERLCERQHLRQRLLGEAARAEAREESP